MFCHVCQESADKFLCSQLPRKLALELICERLAALISEDENLVEDSINACQRIVEELEQPDPKRLSGLQRRLVRVDGKIQFILDAPGETDEDQEENRNRLTTLRRELATIRREIAEQEDLVNRPLNIPKPAEIRQQLKSFAEVLRQAAEIDHPDELAAARQIIEIITGGRILVSQCGERKRNLGWLRARFSVDLIHVINIPEDDTPSKRREIGIDIQPRDPTDRDVEVVMELYDSGLMIQEIAEQTGWHRNRVTKLVNRWFLSQGMPMPDSRSRRETLPKKQRETPAYQKIADEVRELWLEGVSDLEMARRFVCSDVTVQKAFAWWHTSKNLQVPNKETRRLALRNRVKRLYDERVPLKEIAKQVGVSDVTARQLLEDWHAAHGLSMQDRRTRRHLPDVEDIRRTRALSTRNAMGDQPGHGRSTGMVGAEDLTQENPERHQGCIDAVLPGTVKFLKRRRDRFF